MASASVDLLSAACAHLTRSPEEREADHRGDETRDAAIELDTWDAADWRAALLDVPLDERAYADRFGIERSAEMDRLWAWWSDRTDERVTHATTGYLGFFLLTLISMHRSDRMRYHGESYGSSEIADRPGDELCGELVAHPYVQHAIEHLYAPSEEDDEAAVWDTIDFATMAFHRQGTTSIIVKVDSVAPKAGDPEEYALKCLIYPYLRIQPIVEATRGYKREFGGKRPKDSPLVTVWDSYDSWVLMDSSKGRRSPTTSARPPSSAGNRSPRSCGRSTSSSCGPSACSCSTRWKCSPRTWATTTTSHPRTSSSGSRRLPFEIKLIDLGVNFLHTRTLVGAESRESVYIAPEVKAKGKGGHHADLYSVGMVLIAIGGIPHSAPGTVPDQFYVASVGLARLLEDLLDADPEQRLAVSGIDDGPGRFAEIRDLFVCEIEVLEAAEKEQPKTRYERLKNLLPGSGAVKRQREIWKVRRKQAKATDKATHPMRAHHLRQAKGLKRWAVACALLSWATLALVLTWWSRDLDFFWQAKWVEYANGILNRSGDQGIPVLDDIRAADYPIPAAWDNLPVRIVALAYAIPGLRLYMNIFADMTPRPARRRRGWRGVRTAAASFMMRASAVYPTVYILLPTLVQRRWWFLFAPLGIITVATMITACLWFARDANARARAWNGGKGLSTVPKGEIMTLQRMESWAPAAWLYALPVVIIGIFLYNDRLQDELMYAIAIALINIGIWTFKNTGSDAPYVRAGLTRAILAAERLDVLEANRKAKAEAARKRAPDPRADEPLQEAVA